MRVVLACLAVLAFASTAHAQAPEVRPAGFVNAADIVPGLVVDMRYYGANNFVGRRIAGYDAPLCLLSREAATALARAQDALKAFGLGLKVFDCYRPARSVADFVAWSQDANDQAQKATYYPNIDKSRLFAEGYIANRSGHSRGSTIDLTLVDLATGQELDMGTPFDMFDTRSWPTDERMSVSQRANRMLLQSVMSASGFTPYAKEWWHFSLRNQPYAVFFDFPVAAN